MSKSDPVPRRLSNLCRNEHVELLNGLNNKTAWSKEADLGYGNQIVSVAHDDRTVLELVQNARDAIIDGDGKGHVSVIVGPDSLMVANTGSPFRLDDQDVFSAVTSLGRSAKAQDRGSIGEKGVGLKSILQLSEQFSIYSQVDSQYLSAHFSRARAARMVLAMYVDLLDEPDFTGQFQGDNDETLIEVCRALADEVDDNVYPEYLNAEQVRTQLLEEEQEPPSPASILSDLPRLSLFRYPFPDGVNNDSPLRSKLVGETDSDHSSSDLFGDDLQSWLRAEEDTFTTIIELDYVDDDWRTLLDRVDSGLDGVDTQVLSTFRNNRLSATTDQDSFADQRQEELWKECADISPETLILLGEIDQLDLVRVTRDEEGTLRMDDYREITVEYGDTRTLPEASAVRQRPVTYRKARSRDDESITHTRKFRQYTRTYSDIRDGDEQGEADDDLHLLIEKPKLNTEWHPESKPLYLYYPIEEVETPFPFAVHAPFRVDFDRQSLTEDNQNKRILEKLPGLIANAATDLATNGFPESGSSTSFAKWMPWLMTPVAPVNLDDKSSRVNDAIKKTFDQLRDEPIVPTDTGEPQKPSETLVDPQRLRAFEALRERAPAPPLPAASSVETGQAWRDAIVASPEEFREWTANVGLTVVLDRPRDNERGRGSIDLLCDHWEASDVLDNDWAISVNNAEYAEQYFGAIHGILQSASEGDELDRNNGTVAKEAANKLGKEKVPLLPAEAHQKGDTSETASVTHLVRARSRSTTDDSGASRSERIVFRRTASGEDSNRSSIGNLPTPPDELPVFVIPFRTNWSGALEGYNRDWGTRNLDSPTAFYRRVAAEAGGFSGSPRSSAEVVEYIANLYQTVTENRVAESLRPKPHHHHQFEDVEETIRGTKADKAPTDYDDFLERRYTQRVQLPVAAGRPDTDEMTTRPADTLTFGTEWADEFANAAEILESTDSDRYQFKGDESREETRAEAFRRWSSSVKLAANARSDRDHEVAPPNHNYWDDIFGDVNTSDSLDRVRRLDTLIHLGVQVGPRIEWQWSLPQQAQRNREVGAITASEAESLSRGEIPDSGTFSPPTDLLESYQDVVWRSDNDPAFSASHSKECRKKWLNPDIDEWISRYDGALIPTWWFFPDIPEAEKNASARYRDATLLMWPELDDAIIETAWVCNSQHQFKSPQANIPSLGVVQLARRELWPAESTSKDHSAENRLIVHEGEYFQAEQLLLDERDAPHGAAQYLPRVDINALEDSLSRATSSGELVEVDISSALQSLGISRLDNLTPPMAAERLDWFLSQFTVSDSGTSSRMVEVRSSWSSRSMSVPVNGLMRQLVADEALSRRFEEREPKRQWIRRDLYNLGTLIPVTEGDASKVLYIGEDYLPDTAPDTVVFTETLSKFARARLVNDQQRFVERPAEPAEIAYMLGGRDSADDFGIRLCNDPPTPRAVNDAEEELDEEQLREIRSRLRERHEFLLAACLENTAGNLEEINRKLTTVFENPIGVVQRKGTDGRRNSAKWEVPDSTGGPRIALFYDSLNRSQNESEAESERIPAYLAADGLVQVIDQYYLRDTFEAILFKDTNALENEYRNTLRDVRRDIGELRSRRLDRTYEGLSSLATTIADDVALSPPKNFDVDQRATLQAVRTAVNSWSMEDTRETAGAAIEMAVSDNPLLRSWIDELADSCSLSRENAAICLLSAATEDHEVQLRLILQLDSTNVLDADELADAGEQWRHLEVWPDDQKSRSVEVYAEQADQIQRFFEYLTEHEDEGEDGIHRAISEASSTHSPPSPLTTGAELGPASGALVTDPDLSDRRLIEFAYVGQETPALEELAETVKSWVMNECEDLRKSDVIYHDPEINELFNRLSDAAGETEDPTGNVKEAFDDFRNRTGRQITSIESSRTERTADWIAATDDSLEEISQKFFEASAGSTTEGGSPDIGESSGTGYDHVNAQIDARGRDGELICLERAWNRFRDASEEVRSNILQELQKWRSYDRWRLDTLDDVASSVSDPALGTVTGSDELVDILAREELNGGRPERAAFHALFDTSAERGPGFDLIDPFATMPNNLPLSRWSADWMHRVEAKAVASNRLRKGRIKLTGNELRMALREGPDSEGTDARRYIVRLVGFPTEWRDEEIGTNEVQLLDIENVVEFAGLDPEATSILEKLRGGSFYITFNTRG